MIGLDTNVLLRYLVQDDPVQSPRATEIITRQLTEQEPGFVSLVTILEVVWVLKSLYKRTRQEIANDIEMVLAADTLEVQNEQEVYHAVVALRNGTGTFEDALIGSLGIWRGCSATLTFDEKAAQRLCARIARSFSAFHCLQRCTANWQDGRRMYRHRIASVPGHHRLTFEGVKLAVGKPAETFAEYQTQLPDKRNEIDYRGRQLPPARRQTN